MGWNPLDWFKSHPASQQTVDVKAKPSNTDIVRSPGGKLGATDGVTRIRTNQNVPGGAGGGGIVGGLLRTGAQTLGIELASKVAQSAGTPGASRMSLLGLGPDGKGSDAPVYETPINSTAQAPESSMKPNEDGSRRSSDGSTVYSADGKRYTVNGVTYDLATGQAVNPATNEISEGGYSITPETGERVDTPKAKPAAPATTVKTNMADASELERYRVWVGANEGLARKVKPGQAGYEEIQQILEAKDGNNETDSTPQTTSDPKNPTDGASGLPDAADLERTFEIKQKDGNVQKITGQQAVDFGQSFAQEYIKRVKSGEIKPRKQTEPAATPSGADKYQGVDIGKIRISNADYNKMTGPIGDFIPQLKGLGAETTFDPVTKTWRIIATTDSAGVTKTYN